MPNQTEILEEQIRPEQTAGEEGAEGAEEVEAAVSLMLVMKERKTTKRNSHGGKR